MARKKKVETELEVKTPEVVIEQVEELVPVDTETPIESVVSVEDESESLAVVEEESAPERVVEDNSEISVPVVATPIPEDDDELAIQALEDDKIELSDDYGVFKQQEGMIAWSIENLYREDGIMRSKKELKLEPPILRIEASDGQSVDFILTKNFTKTLKDGLDDVYRGTFGIQKAKTPISGFREALFNSVMENPLRVVVLGLLVVLCAALAIFN